LAESVDKVKIRELLESASADDTEMSRLTSILSQIHGRLADTGAKSKISLSSLLDKLSDGGVNLTAKQFRDMVEEEPLKNLIANVSGDQVVFLGQGKDKSDAMDPDQSTHTLEKMAKRAEKKRD
jgi:hypothetical protein